MGRASQDIVHSLTYDAGSQSARRRGRPIYCDRRFRMFTSLGQYENSATKSLESLGTSTQKDSESDTWGTSPCVWTVPQVAVRLRMLITPLSGPARSQISSPCKTGRKQERLPFASSTYRRYCHEITARKQSHHSQVKRIHRDHFAANS